MPVDAQSELDDAQLIRRYQSGDVAACNALLARHRDRLFRLAVAWLRDSDEAEDVVQDVFARALRGLRGFRFEATAGTWFYRTCRLVCHEFNRRRFPEGLDHEPTDVADGPADAAQRRDVQRRLRRALRVLSPAQRDVVLLRDFEELSVRETAAILDVTEGTVKTQHHRARAKLRSTLAAEHNRHD